MTTLVELKQKLKSFYGKYEAYLVPLIKFVIAFLFFLWINSSLGYTAALNSVFVVLIFALLCAILPINAIIVIGFVMIIGHCYSLGLEAAGFAVIIALVMLIMFLRFTRKENELLALTPLAFSLQIPALVPVGAGLVKEPRAAASGGCGVVLYFFVRMINEQSAVLQNSDGEAVTKIKLLIDGMVANKEMWVVLIAYVIVTILVYAIRKSSFDYSWRVAIIVGAVTYVFIRLVGGLFLEIDTDILSLVIFSILSAALAFVIEFFAFGGDYSRVETIQYEDDDYFYFVKAVPKATIATSKRRIKKINAEPIPEEEPESQLSSELQEVEDAPEPDFTNSMFEDEEDDALPLEPVEATQEIDFEKKLEESLKDL